MASSFGPLELPNIPLPPIPGPIPLGFFTNIPPDSAAVFSTISGTRPLRPLPYPIPVQSIRLGNDEDIRNKAGSLLKTYPAIAEPIFSPPATWQDLYYYFDATDLWMEGAGFLFHVLGVIVKLNFARFDCIQNYVSQWALLNESRLANMPPQQDFLDSLQTPDDQAWFNYDMLSSYEKELLNSTIKEHHIALRTKIAASQALHLHSSDHFVVGARSYPYDRSADSYQHSGTQGYTISPKSSQDISQLMATHWEANNSQDPAAFNPHYRDRSMSRSYVGPRGAMNDSSHQVVLRNVTPIAENQFVPSAGRPQFPIDRRKSIRSIRPSESFQSHPLGLKDPVYVLDPQKPQANLHKVIVGGDDPNNIRSPPIYSYQWPQNTNFQGRNSRDIQGSRHNANTPFTVFNDARLQYDNRVSRPDGSAPAVPWHAKHTARKVSWQESDLNKGYAVYVAGFPIEDSTRDRLEELFSDCGDIVYVKVLAEKSCAFINFQFPESVSKAIDRFNGYSTPGGKVLTVQYPIPRPRVGSYSNRDKRAVPGEQAQAYISEQPPTPIRNARAYDGRDHQKSVKTTHSRSASPSSFNAPCELSPVSCDQGKTTLLAQVDMNALESNIQYLPPKPPTLFTSLTGGDSAIPSLNSQLDGIKSLVQTPSKTLQKTQHAATQARATATERNHSVENFARGGYGRVDGCDSSKVKRKTPKKSKDSPDVVSNSNSGVSTDAQKNRSRKNTPTTTPVKELSVNSVNFPTTHSTNNSLNGRVAIPLPRAQSPAKRSSPTGPKTIIKDDLPQIQSFLNLDSPTECPQMTSVALSAQNHSEAVSPSQDECIKTSEQYPFTCNGSIGPNEGLFHNNMPAAISETNEVVIAGVLDLLADSKQTETASDPPQQAKKKKTKAKRNPPHPSKASGGEIVMDNVNRLTQDSFTSSGSREISRAETRSHLETDSNATSSSATSCQGTPIKKANSVPAAHGKSIEGKQGDSTPPQVPARQSDETKQLSQYKATDGDDVFQDKKPTLQRHTRNSERQSQGKIDLDGSITPSSGNSNPTAKKTRTKIREESPTPTGKHHSRARSSKNEKRGAITDRKENKKPEPSATEILSDPSHWPALGTIKLQLDTRVSSNQTTTSLTKPLGERTLQPALLRRDSLASVVTNSPATNSPQPIRRLTIDSPCSPASGGSRLWPVVKRWDSHGLPSGDNGDSRPSSRVST